MTLEQSCYGQLKQKYLLILPPYRGKILAPIFPRQAPL